MLESVVIWAWDQQMTQQAFSTLLRNFGIWHERNSAPESAYTGLYAIMIPLQRSAGRIMMVVQIDAGIPGADAMVTDFVSAITAGSGVTPVVNARRTLPWLHATTWPGTGQAGDVATRRYKIKAAYLRSSFTEDQLATIHQHLSAPGGPSDGGMLLVGYGGQVQAVAPDATATAQRDVVMKAVYQTIWADESGDAANLAWIRDFYRDTGGVPVPNDISDGSYINYPDNDLADPTWNTSGVPWSALYYKGNYRRLQQVKARWDPGNVFQHTLGVEPRA